MRYALARVTGRDVHILVARIAPDEARIIDRIQNLSGPAMGFPAE